MVCEGMENRNKVVTFSANIVVLRLNWFRSSNWRLSLWSSNWRLSLWSSNWRLCLWSSNFQSACGSLRTESAAFKLQFDVKSLISSGIVTKREDPLILKDQFATRRVFSRLQCGLKTDKERDLFRNGFYWASQLLTILSKLEKKFCLTSQTIKKVLKESILSKI